jgi:hypothetical protein
MVNGFISQLAHRQRAEREKSFCLCLLPLIYGTLEEQLEIGTAISKGFAALYTYKKDFSRKHNCRTSDI